MNKNIILAVVVILLLILGFMAYTMMSAPSVPLPQDQETAQNSGNMNQAGTGNPIDDAADAMLLPENDETTILDNTAPDNVDFGESLNF